MALPPLELFSLTKRPPCCRVASSLIYTLNLRPGPPITYAAHRGGYPMADLIAALVFIALILAPTLLLGND